MQPYRCESDDHRPFDYCDCLFRSVYSALRAHPSQVEKKIGLSCIYDLMQRVINEPGSLWTAEWEKCYGCLYDLVVSRGTSCLRSSDNNQLLLAPWIERFFALDTLRTRRMFVQLARYQVLERKVHATEPECIAVCCFLEAHRIHMVVRNELPIRSTRSETNEFMCIHLFRNESGHYNPIIDARAARSVLFHGEALHNALFVFKGGSAPSSQGLEPPNGDDVQSSGETPPTSQDHSAFKKMIMSERRYLLKKRAIVQSKIEACLKEKEYTRCELHHRNKRVVHIQAKKLDPTTHGPLVPTVPMALDT